MTDTLISIISIFIGIIGANLLSILKKKYSLGFTGNVITGIFGSIFLVKFFGRLGFGPQFIMETGTVNISLFTINILVSLIGGAIGLFLAFLVIHKLNK